jgi:Glyoxalase-like domain
MDGRTIHDTAMTTGDRAQSFPPPLQVVLDTTDVRGLAEFYRKLLGYVYRRGDEPPPPDQTDERGQDWLVIEHPSGTPRIAFQQTQRLPRSTWPEADVPQQLHLDLMVPSLSDFELQHQRALELGATVLYDRSHDEQEPLRVYADLAGHPFCIFVG